MVRLAFVLVALMISAFPGPAQGADYVWDGGVNSGGWRPGGSGWLLNGAATTWVAHSPVTFNGHPQTNVFMGNNQFVEVPTITVTTGAYTFPYTSGQLYPNVIDMQNDSVLNIRCVTIGGLTIKGTGTVNITGPTAAGIDDEIDWVVIQDSATFKVQNRKAVVATYGNTIFATQFTLKDTGTLSLINSLPTTLVLGSTATTTTISTLDGFNPVWTGNATGSGAASTLQLLPATALAIKNFTVKDCTWTLPNVDVFLGGYAAIASNASIGNFGSAAGTISRPGALTKIGTGTLTLSGTNAYTGGTAVSAGVLSVTGLMPTTGAVAVNSSGTLEGTGTIRSAVAVNAGGTLRGGVANVGTLNLANGFATVKDSILAIRLASTGTPGTNGTSTDLGALPNPARHNFLHITGGSTSINSLTKINVDLAGLAFSIDQPYSYQIADGAGNQSTLYVPAGQFTFTNGAVLDGSASLSGNSTGAVCLSFTPLPEPPLALLLPMGLLLRHRQMS